MKNMQKDDSKGKKEKAPKVAEAEIIRENKESTQSKGKRSQERQVEGKRSQESKEEQENTEKEGRYTVFDYSSIKRTKGARQDELSLASILNKCETESAKINTFLHTKEFRRVLLEQYKILPSLLTKSMVNEFIKELDSNENYIQYLQEWKSLN